MRPVITFTVPGLPVAQPRQRSRVMQTAAGAVAQNYTPTKHPANVFKAATRIAAAMAYKGQPLTGPLKVRLVFVMPRPARLVWKKREMPRAWHCAKPDCDNLAKSTFDALSGLLFVDDAAIASLAVVKLYAAGDEQPHVEVTVERMEG